MSISSQTFSNIKLHSIDYEWRTICLLGMSNNEHTHIAAPRYVPTNNRRSRHLSTKNLCTGVRHYHYTITNAFIQDESRSRQLLLKINSLPLPPSLAPTISTRSPTPTQPLPNKSSSPPSPTPPNLAFVTLTTIPPSTPALTHPPVLSTPNLPTR